MFGGFDRPRVLLAKNADERHDACRRKLQFRRGGRPIRSAMTVTHPSDLDHGALGADAARAVLRWYLEAGVDEAVAETPCDVFARCFSEAETRPGQAADWQAADWQAADRQAAAREAASVRGRGPRTTTPAKAVAVISGENAISADEAIADAARIAAGAASIESLCAAIEAFEGCALRKGARSTVVLDGAPRAPLLVIGEAPGKDEDRIGKPFVGRAGALLDRMLATIGMSRAENVLITNIVFWRPPGNRTPTRIETAICRPFLDRLIELSQPRAVLLAGAAPTQTLLGETGIMRSRGRWRSFETAGGFKATAMPTLHPAYLLRQPAQKRLAWADLQRVQSQLTES